MPMNDFKRENRLHRAGKVRLGRRIRKCPACSAQVVIKKKLVEVCPQCRADLKEVPVHPVSTDHFVLDDAPELVAIYGETPTRLNIYFPFDTIEENMPSFHKFRQASSLVCQGDGQRITYAIDPLTGRPIIRDGVALVDFKESDAAGKQVQYRSGDFMPCPGREHNLYRKCAFCKPNTTLRFLVREVPRMAYFEINTTSIHNYMMLSGQLDYYTLPEPKGLGIGLKYVPFYLDLRPTMISVPNLDRNGQPKKVDGKPQPKMMMEKHLLTLEIEPAFMARLSQAKRQLMDPVRLMLSAPMPPMAEEWNDDYDDEPESQDEASPAGMVIIPPKAPFGFSDPPLADDAEGEVESEPVPPGGMASTGHCVQKLKEEPAGASRKILAPAELKAVIEKKAGQSNLRDKETSEFLPVTLHPFGGKTANLVSAKFEEAFKPHPRAGEMYHAALKWLTGQDTARKLTAAQADALLDWLLNGNKELKWKAVVVAPAPEEALLVYQEAVKAETQVQADAGQIGLPL